ncbi:hypothetical protein [Agrococcus carbonis]|uniref:Uncharacterized protein n=1 Tax=Agrococcus carbonis TaxID=684552 RepID=A0A1H1RL80_9MICO|nr:hypothetical protein [Agrococcus carbonis]SDS36422.1 hypothetical protein SAMN04489719_2152 [Agrococcus carbonis]
MHYLLGLAALVMGAVIATRRTRPTWFVVLTCVLVGVGALLAILSYTRVTDPLGLIVNSVAGWIFVGLSIITMLSAIFVLERRGEFGEERPPLIGDNPLDGDTDDSDDPAHGTAPAVATGARTGSGAEPRATGAVLGGAAAVGAAGSAASGSPGAAGIGASGTEAFAAESVERPEPPTDPDFDAWTAAGEPSAPRTATPTTEEAGMTHHEHDASAHEGGHTDAAAHSGEDAAMESGLRAAFGAGAGDPGAHTDERPAERLADRPTASDGAEDGTTVIGADPDLATDPADTDVDAAPEGSADDGRGSRA